MTGLLQALPVTRTGLLSVSLLMLVAATACLAAAATRARLRRYLRTSVTGLLALALATTGLTGTGVSQAAANCCPSTFPGHGKSSGGSSNSGSSKGGSSNFGGGAGGSFDDGPDFGGGAGGYFGSDSGNGSGQRKQTGGGGNSSSSHVCTGCGARAGTRAREMPSTPLGTRASRAPSTPSGGGKQAANNGHAGGSNGSGGSSSKQSGGSKKSNGSGKQNRGSQNHSGGGGSGTAQKQTRTSKGTSTSRKHGSATGGSSTGQKQTHTAKGTSRHTHGGTAKQSTSSGNHVGLKKSSASKGTSHKHPTARGAAGTGGGAKQAGSRTRTQPGGNEAKAGSASGRPNLASSASTSPPNVPGLPSWWNPDNPWSSIDQHVAPGDQASVQNLLLQAAAGQIQVPGEATLIQKYPWLILIIVAVIAVGAWLLLGPGASSSGGYLPLPADPVGFMPRKVVNSNMAHIDASRAARAGFSDVASAQQALRELGKQIEAHGFPTGTIRDSAHADRVLVPFGTNGYAVYQILKNGNAVLKTILIRR